VLLSLLTFSFDFETRTSWIWMQHWLLNGYKLNCYLLFSFKHNQSYISLHNDRPFLTILCVTSGKFVRFCCDLQAPGSPMSRNVSLASIDSMSPPAGNYLLIIDRVAGAIIRLVASVCVCVCLSVGTLLFDLWPWFLAWGSAVTLARIMDH